MMNKSELFTSIKGDLGILGVKLPLEDENAEFDRIIKQRSIKTFSQFYPHIMRIDMELNSMQVLKSHYNESVYQIPDVFGDRRILYIRKVDTKNKLLGNGYLNPIFEESMDLYNMGMMAQASANNLSNIIPPFTFKFEQPNILYLYNMSTMFNQLTIEFALEHFDNLSSIPNTAWESFYELVLLDLKHHLYGILKHYDSLQTAHGTINLRIDDWADARSERKDLIERWRDSYHLDTEQFFII